MTDIFKSVAFYNIMMWIMFHNASLLVDDFIQSPRPPVFGYYTSVEAGSVTETKEGVRPHCSRPPPPAADMLAYVFVQAGSPV